MFYFGPISSTTLLWIIAIIVFIVAELSTMGLTTVWFVGGALVSAILSAMKAPLLVQIIVFIVVSAALMAFIRPIAVKYFNPKRTRTNVDALIGKLCTITERIDNTKECGRVKVDGMEWSARSYIYLKPLEKDTQAIIRAVEGNKLIVEELVLPNSNHTAQPFATDEAAMTTSLQQEVSPDSCVQNRNNETYQ